MMAQLRRTAACGREKSVAPGACEGPACLDAAADRRPDARGGGLAHRGVNRRRVIVTADDFGFSPGGERGGPNCAHRERILTTASLMVAADATADAVERARALPSLRVGLHLVVVNGRPVLPPAAVPHLVDARGDFPTDCLRAGIHYFFDPRARRELEAEIRAQFEAFEQTGLRTRSRQLSKTTCTSIPRSWRRLSGSAATTVSRRSAYRTNRSFRRGAARTGISACGSGTSFCLLRWRAICARGCANATDGASNDYRVFGLNDTGRMTAERVLRIFENMPGGVNELYFHPDEGNVEFASLIDPAVIEAARAGCAMVSFAELAGMRAG